MTSKLGATEAYAPIHSRHDPKILVELCRAHLFPGTADSPDYILRRLYIRYQGAYPYR